jgi:phosphoribosyl-ATP pyrophosphohydrolase
MDDNSDMQAVFDDLFETIESRQENLPADSYTTALLTHEKGENVILEKVGEEATETILAAKDGDKPALQAESADLLYHLFVLCVNKGLTLDEIREELQNRF